MELAIIQANSTICRSGTNGNYNAFKGNGTSDILLVIVPIFISQSDLRSFAYILATLESKTRELLPGTPLKNGLVCFFNTMSVPNQAPIILHHCQRLGEEL